MIDLMRKTIDQFNSMLLSLQSKMPSLHYIDVRGTLSTVLIDKEQITSVGGTMSCILPRKVLSRLLINLLTC